MSSDIHSSKQSRRVSSSHNHQRLQFLEWTIDLTSGELFRNGDKVRLQEKPFQILAILLQRPGEVITRRELRASVWSENDTDADASLNTAVRKLRQALGDSPQHPKIIKTVGSSGYQLLVQPQNAVTSEFVGPVRLAVLPFHNLSSSEHDNFADWLTEQMIVQLADPQANIKVVIPVLKPSHRAALADAGQNIDADYVLSGSMIKTNSLVRVTAKLTRSSDDECIWSETYSRQVVDAFRFQDELTLQIACSILQVIPGTVSQEQETTPGAYGKTLKGRHFADKWDEPSLRRAVAFLQQAIDEDPGFARAHSALARTHASMLQYGVLQPSLNAKRVRDEAMIALELCPDLPDAIVALGCAHFFYDADWAAAERSFQRALRISPQAAYAHAAYARLLIYTGRTEESIAAALHAHEFGPVSPYSNTVLGAAYYFAHRFEEAIKPCTDCIEMEPNFSMARAILGRVHEAMGHFDDAIEAYRGALACAPDSAVLIANLAHGLAVAGQTDEALSLLNKVLSLRASSYVPAYWIAVVYVGLGEYESGLEWLRVAVGERCGWRVMAGVDPKLDVLRNDAEFIAILKQIGFPQVVGPLPSHL